MLGITLSYHRQLAHLSFKSPKAPQRKMRHWKAMSRASPNVGWFSRNLWRYTSWISMILQYEFSKSLKICRSHMKPILKSAWSLGDLIARLWNTSLRTVEPWLCRAIQLTGCHPIDIIMEQLCLGSNKQWNTFIATAWCIVKPEEVTQFATARTQPTTFILPKMDFGGRTQGGYWTRRLFIETAPHVINHN